jgi:hypothetical protein
MAGFPWENQGHLDATRRLIFDLDADFIEIHIPIPYAKTALARSCVRAGQTNGETLGHDYFGHPVALSPHLSRTRIQRFRKRVLFTYYARPTYIVARLRDTLDHPIRLIHYGRYALRLLRNLFT